MDDFFGIGMGEILLILVVAVIALGPARMVEVGRTLGRWMNTLKKMSADLTLQVTKEAEEEKRAKNPVPPGAQTTTNNTASTVSTPSELESIKARLAAAEAKLKFAESQNKTNNSQP